MVSAQSILTISRNRILQQTRTLILEQAGYSVSAAHSDEEALRFLEASEPYGLVLVCHSVPEASRVRLVNAMKAKFPSMPILMLYNGYAPTAAQVDGSVLCMDTSPVSLLTMIGFLTRRAQSRLSWPFGGRAAS